MDNVLPLLQKLGLSEKEVKIYITLLSVGTTSVRKLAELAGVNRGTTYDVLKSLRTKGLVTYFHKNKNQYFAAEDPESLHALLGARQSDLTEVASHLSTIVPELRSLHGERGGKPAVRFYEGAEGVRSILEDVLATMQTAETKEYYVYSHQGVRDELYDKFKDYNQKRIAAGIAVKSISFGKGGTLAGLDERKWLDTAGEQLTYILIYDGRCAFVARDKAGELVGVIIENAGIYQTQKLIFLNIWKMLPQTK